MATKRGRAIRRLDASDFYWAVLALPERREGGYSAERNVLDNLLDTELPVPVERVQAAFVDVGSGRVLACAIDRERLLKLVEDDPAAVVPAGLPSWLRQDVDAATVELQGLNVLRGDFEPRFRRAAHRGRCQRVWAIAALVLLVAIAGMERRRAAALRCVREADQRAMMLADELTPKASALPPYLRLAAEARRVAAASEEAKESPHPVSAWPMLRSVLQAWPETGEGWLDSARADDSSIALTLGAIDAGRLGDLVQQIAEGSDLRADQPTITAGVHGARAVVSLRPLQPAEGNTP